VAVLDLLGDSADGLTGAEIARHLGVHPSTASRLLGTIAAGGLIERDRATQRFRIGARVVGLAAAAVDRLPVVSQARPQLEHLSAVTSETANLAIRDGLHVVYVDQVTPAQTVVMASWVGRRSPVHASSSGKVLVAFGEPALQEAVLGRALDPITARTIVSPTELRRVWAQTRRQGYATSSGELEDGLVTIAAPVIVDGRAVAAISVSGPAFRLPQRDVPRLGQAVINAARAASLRMAGR
jgi:DNA-binding IclR family transcriptional regulator